MRGRFPAMFKLVNKDTHTCILFYEFIHTYLLHGIHSIKNNFVCDEAIAGQPLSDRPKRNNHKYYGWGHLSEM